MCRSNEVNQMNRYVLCIAQKFPFNGTRFVISRTTNRGATRQYLSDFNGDVQIFSDLDAAKQMVKSIPSIPVVMWTAETRMPA